MATSANRTYVFTKNSSAQWATNNTVLGNLEVGIERDTGMFKIGNGIQSWNTIPYVVTPGTRGLIVFISDDPDNIITYGTDGGFKLVGEYFNGISDYNAAKTGNTTVPVPTKLYNQTIYTIGKDIKDLLLEVSNAKHRLDVLGPSVTIDNTTLTSATKTWSAGKIVDYILETKLAIKDELLNGNGAAYDALRSLATYLATDPNLATSLANELGTMVKFNTTQSLTSTQKDQVLDNIGAASAANLGTPEDLIAIYNTALSDTTGSPFIEREI